MSEETNASPVSAPPPESHSSFPHELRGWVRDLAVAMSLALIIIVFLYQPVKVEGTSMAPLALGSGADFHQQICLPL